MPPESVYSFQEPKNIPFQRPRRRAPAEIVAYRGRVGYEHLHRMHGMEGMHGDVECGLLRRGFGISEK